MTNKTEKIIGVLLAGGLARRMGGGDKPLKTLGGKPILDQVIERARSQVDTLILNANGEQDRFKAYGLPVVKDVIEGYAGPLAGILSGMEWTRENVEDGENAWLASFACDAPFFPLNLIRCLFDEIQNAGADMACARSNNRSHPVFALWPVALAGDLRKAMEDEGVRKIDLWTGRYNTLNVEFSYKAKEIDPFFNINRPDDLLTAEKWLKSQSS